MLNAANTELTAMPIHAVRRTCRARCSAPTVLLSRKPSILVMWARMRREVR